MNRSKIQRLEVEVEYHAFKCEQYCHKASHATESSSLVDGMYLQQHRQLATYHALKAFELSAAQAAAA